MEINNQKVDSLGRTHRSVEERERIMGECEASGKSRKEFARERGITYGTLMDWFGKRKSKDRPIRLKPVDTTPLFSINSGTGALAEIILRGGTTVRIYREGSGKFFKELLNGLD